MKKTRGYKIWQVLYPVAVYYLISGLVYFVLEILLGRTAETYMLRQTICSASTIPFVLSFYRLDRIIRESVYGKKRFAWNRQQFENIGISLAAAAALGMALNNFIAMTPLMEASAGFEQANQGFFGGQLIFELLGSCLIVPIAEELLFRGVVYQRLKEMLGVAPGILLSALLFGVAHANWVQFIYAGVLGALLAYLVEKTGYLYVAMLGHIAANGAAVLRQHTGWLNFAYEPDAAGILFSAGLLAAGAAALWYLKRREESAGGQLRR